MRNALLRISGIVALALAAATTAKATTVTFDDADGNAILFQDESVFSDQGLSFTNHGTFMYVWDSASPNSNGTNNNIFAGFTSADYETITKVGGGTFNLQSIDMAISWYDGNPTETILVNGSALEISQTLTTYNLGLVGVTSVTISGVPSNTGYWLADNVTYTSGVPEVSTWAMLLLGFSALGAFSYRGSRKAAALAA